MTQYLSDLYVRGKKIACIQIKKKLKILQFSKETSMPFFELNILSLILILNIKQYF